MLPIEKIKDSLSELLTQKYAVKIWGFNKEYWSKENKELLQLYVPKMILPKLGRLTQQKKEEEKVENLEEVKIDIVL